MILNLPLELLLNISSRLEIEDKLNLKLTCHKLDKIVTTTVLYEDLDLLKWELWLTRMNNHKKSGDKIIQKLMDNNFDGSGVKVLRVDADSLTDPILSRLSNFFPNITRVIVPKDEKRKYSKPYPPPELTKDREKPLEKWKKTVTAIYSDNDWNELTSDVFCSKYTKLTELSLQSLPYPLPQRKVSIINAPLLTRLILRRTSISFNILESIHAGCPLLMSLKLQYPSITLKDGLSLPKSIRPAKTLLYLEIIGATNIHIDNGVFMDYIVKKYTNLQHLVFNLVFQLEYNMRALSYIESQKLLSDLVNSEESLSLYKAIEARFFSNLPKSLKKLTLHINNIDNAIEALSKLDAKITMLDLLDHERDHRRRWENTNVLEHFQKLTVLKTLKISFNSSVQTFTQPLISSSVTRLVLELYGDTFYMDWILSMFPLVEELSIHSPKLYGVYDREIDELKWRSGNSIVDGDDKETHSRAVYPRLRSLTIKRYIVSSDFFDYIKTTMPNLDELNLRIDMTLYLSTKKITPSFDLSNCCLNKCNISFGCVNKAIIYPFVTIQNTTKQFVFDCNNKCLLPAGRYYHKDNPRYWATLKFDSVKQLKIFGYSIAKIGDELVITY